jgi:hypothetical protein
MVDIVLIIQIIFILAYPIIQYKNDYPDLFGSLVCIGNFQFITIPLIVYKYDLRNIEWYPYYKMNDDDFSYLVIYTTISIISFFLLKKLVKIINNKKDEKLCIYYSYNIISLIILLIILYNYLSFEGYLFQGIDYIFQGFVAYIFLIFVMKSNKVKADYFIMGLSLFTFYGSSVRFVYIIISLLIYISNINKNKRPNLFKLIACISIIAVISMFFKIYVKNNLPFELIFDNIYHRIITFDLSNVESLWIASHYHRDGDLLFGKTLLSSLVVPWLLDDSFVGMGKFYINNILFNEDISKVWSVSYPFPYELMANFGFIFGVLFFCLFYFTINYLISNKKNSFYLHANLFGMSFVYFTFRGDFVFAFTPTLFAALGGFLAHLLLTHSYKLR